MVDRSDDNVAKRDAVAAMDYHEGAKGGSPNADGGDMLVRITFQRGVLGPRWGG